MSVQVEVVSPRLLAAVRREVAAGRVRDVWRPALDQVWHFCARSRDCEPMDTTSSFITMAIR